MAYALRALFTSCVRMTVIDIKMPCAVPRAVVHPFTVRLHTRPVCVLLWLLHLALQCSLFDAGEVNLPLVCCRADD